MKTALILPCVVLWLSPRVTSVDPLATQFRQFINDRLSDVNADGLSLLYNLSNYRLDLIQSSDGWMSLREGQLHNLTSWSRSRDSAVTCGGKYAFVSANISFEPLSFSYRYYVDNGTSLSSARDLTGTLTGLSARLDVELEAKNTSSSKATFHLLPTEKVTLVFPPEDKTFKEEVTKAILQAQKEEVIPHLQQSIKIIIDDALSRGSTDMSSVSCSSTAATPRNDPSSTAIAPEVTNSAKTIQASTATSVTSITSTVKVMATMKDDRDRLNKSNESNAAVIENQDEEYYTMGGNPVTSQTIQLNKFIDNLLRKAGESFSTYELQPYTMPNSDEELYQATVGSALLVGYVSVNTGLYQSADPEVLKRNGSVRVTAEMELDDLSYNLQFEINSQSSVQTRGKMSRLKGRMIIEANVTNPSATTTRLEGFELIPTVYLLQTSMVSDNVTEEQQLAIADAVKGIFKKKLIPSIESIAEPALEKTLEEKTLDVSEALTYTPPAPTTTLLTTSTLTYTPPAPTTTLLTTSTLTYTPPAPTTTVLKSSTATAASATSTASTTRAVVTSTPPATTAAASQSTVITSIPSTTHAAGVITRSTSASYVSPTAAPTVNLTASAPALPSSSPSTPLGSTAGGTEDTTGPGSSSSLRLRPRWIVYLMALVSFLLTVNTDISL